MPGLRRQKSGRGFRYLDADGKAVRDTATLARIRSLVIPPAYTDVWICPDPKGHLQATGRDARGRKQYRYHPRWRVVRDETKFGRMLAFGAALPGIRARVDEDLALSGLPRRKVLATVVRLLETTCIRVGNDEYARTNKSFGLTTLKDRHVEISGSTIRFEFRGKSGKLHSCDVTDAGLARIVQHCQAIPGEELFQYLDDDGNRQTIGSGDVNDYLREISGQEFTAKDFRTWVGTVLAYEALTELEPARTVKETRANVLQAIDRVASQLNNTRAVCRRYYVHPAVLEAYEGGKLPSAVAGGASRNGRANGKVKGLQPVEKIVARLLRDQVDRAA
jgi:DNA topoisomerase-1